MHLMLPTGCLGYKRPGVKCQRHPLFRESLRKYSHDHILCVASRGTPLSMHTQDVSRSSAAVLWSAINKLQVISFLSKYHICSSKQICKRMPLLINHVTYAYVYIHGHTFSHRVQLTIRCTSDVWRTHGKINEIINAQRDQVPFATWAL